MPTVGVQHGQYRLSKAKDPEFALGLWNVHHRALAREMLTNNNAEAFHRQYKQLQISPKPTVPTCIENLQAQTRITHLDLTKIALGQVKKESVVTQRRTQCIATILERYLATGDTASCLDNIAQLYRTDNGS